MGQRQHLFARTRKELARFDERAQLAIDGRRVESVSEAKAGIARYVAFYKPRRPHRALDGESPNAVYFKSLPLAAAA